MSETKKNIKIFVLDDNGADLDMIDKAFQKYHVENYELFLDPVLFIAKFSLDVNISVVDFRLGQGIDGSDILKQVRIINPYSFNVIISSFVDGDTVIKLGRDGAHDFVNKKNASFIDELIKLIKTISPKIQDRIDFVKDWKPDMKL